MTLWLFIAHPPPVNLHPIGRVTHPRPEPEVLELSNDDEIVIVKK